MPSRVIDSPPTTREHQTDDASFGFAKHALAFRMSSTFERVPPGFEIDAFHCRAMCSPRREKAKEITMNTNLPYIRPVKWEEDVIAGVAGVLAATELGMSGSEIGTTLRALGMDDLSSLATKRNRLSNALIEDQSKVHIATGAMAFISVVMDPSRYDGQSSQFDDRRRDLNKVLVACSLQVDDEGGIRSLAVAS